MAVAGTALSKKDGLKVSKYIHDLLSVLKELTNLQSHKSLGYHLPVCGRAITCTICVRNSDNQFNKLKLCGKEQEDCGTTLKKMKNFGREKIQ